MRCHTDIGHPQASRDRRSWRRVTSPPPFAWTDLTYLLHRGRCQLDVLRRSRQPARLRQRRPCSVHPGLSNRVDPGYLEPAPGFPDRPSGRAAAQRQPPRSYFRDARTGTLPAVSWVVPNGKNSEHPPASIAAGQAWVTRVINAAMRGPDWNSTAIFLSWDDWGGFYDHVVPPTRERPGPRSPGPGPPDQPVRQDRLHRPPDRCRRDSYLRFIEDDFLDGQRLDPRTDGRPDSRPFVAETTPSSATSWRTSTSIAPRPSLPFAAATNAWEGSDPPTLGPWAGRSQGGRRGGAALVHYLRD